MGHQTITSPSGEELVVLPRAEYDRLVQLAADAEEDLITEFIAGLDYERRAGLNPVDHLAHRLRLPVDGAGVAGEGDARPVHADVGKALLAEGATKLGGVLPVNVAGALLLLDASDDLDLVGLAGEPLDTYSQDELMERIALLEAEIERVRAHHAKVSDHKKFADALFKPKEPS